MTTSPFIHFPYTTETAEGVVHSGIFGPCADGTYTVIAVIPDSRRRPYFETGHTSFEEALRVAEVAYLWFDKDESQIQKELQSA
jgi:hypothetical protein